ncbi:pentatricopeptide repeat-containing protein At2g13600 isoform X2 [Cryptomeria japonica]|uniref:pentatricopeptide repeat-containing protein At2g13600 isoform X2 n=1 Tax=Cryptomeria japonica TaxID=3369 RepID=UPI0027DAAF92|nr:pentatricopeptide repeat-containing protein At2g13600 isoform X2 [Cryptomeria japonica]
MYRALCKEGCLKETLHILPIYIAKDALWDSKLIHSFIAAREFSVVTRIIFQNKLINMYATCGSLVDSRKVFDHMTERDTSSWNVIIAALRKYGFSEETLTLFHQMQRTGLQPDQFTFASILPACAKMGTLEEGMEIHQSITRSGFSSDVIVGNALLDMYVKCRSLHKAHKLFDTMPQRNVVSWTVMIVGHAQNGLLDEALSLFKEIPQQDVVSWTAMISGYAQNGLAEKALENYKQMQLADVKPNSATFVSILSACAKMGALEQGMDIHRSIRQSGLSSNVEVGNALLDMYVKCGSMQRAYELFDTMPQRNVVSWTAMISGCAQNGLFEMALETFKNMQLAGVNPDAATFASVFPACAKMEYLEQGIEFHQRVMKCGFLSNVVVGNALINMYAKCGSIQKARKFFDTMSQQDVVSFNGMIAGYAQNGHFEKALELFRQMPQTGVQPDRLTFVNILLACGKMGYLELGIDIHQSINRRGYSSDVGVGYALIDMYAKCNSIQRARELFDTMPERDVVSWTTMIAGYAKNGVLEEALQLLKEMPQQDAISWNAIIARYAQDGLVEKALEIFKQMKLAGVTPNAATFVSILSACTKTGALEQGMDIHKSIRKIGLCSNVLVGSSLIDMYAKCGNIRKARELFDAMPQQDVVSWTAMIAGYGMHGYDHIRTYG